MKLKSKHKLKLNTDLGPINILCDEIKQDPFIKGNVLISGLSGIREDWTKEYFFEIIEWSIPKNDILERCIGNLILKEPVEEEVLEIDEVSKLVSSLIENEETEHIDHEFIDSELSCPDELYEDDH